MSIFGPLLESLLEDQRRENLLRSPKSSQGLNWIHNDYLGLSRDPEILEAGKKALTQAGSTGSRLLGGDHAEIQELEGEIADFFQAPSAVFFGSAYHANLAAVGVLSKICEVVYSDEQNHASLIDAIRLTKLERRIVSHLNWEKLEIGPRTLIVTESLFSMDGDLAPVESLQQLLTLPHVFLLFDEAHAAGIFREEGRGFFPKLTVPWDQLAVTVSFGKAFGVAGAAILCNSTFRQLLYQFGRPLIFSTAPPPAVAAMVRASLQVVRKKPQLRFELWERSSWFRRRLQDVQILPASSCNDQQKSPIIPVVLGSAERALRFAENMRRKGFEVGAIRYPTVPKGTERIRISMNLRTPWDAVKQLADEVIREWKGYSSQQPIQELEKQF